MTDTQPDNGDQDGRSPHPNYAKWGIVLAALAVVIPLFNLLSDLFDWSLPWSPLAGWILAGLAFVVLVLFILLYEPARTRLVVLIKDWRTWILVGLAVLIVLTTMVASLWFRVRKLDSLLLEQGTDLTASLATAAVQSTDIAHLESTVSLLAPTPVLVTPDATTPIPTGSTVIPTSTLTPVPAVPTSEGTAAPMTESIASATPRATSTPTPSPGTPVPSPTPGPIAAEITTKEGTKLALSEFQLYFDYELNGFPIQTGVEVNWDYIDKVEIGEPEDSSEIPVTITLVNGEVVETQMGWKRNALGASVKLQGKSALADVDMDLWDVTTIDYRWSDPLVQIPDSPPTSDVGPAATVITKEGTAIDVTGLHFSCYDCWPVKSATAVPLEIGIKPSLGGVKEIMFGDVVRNSVPVTVTLADGNGIIEDTIFYRWRLRGFAASGEFDLLIQDVATVTLRE